MTTRSREIGDMTMGWDGEWIDANQFWKLKDKAERGRPLTDNEERMMRVAGEAVVRQHREDGNREMAEKIDNLVKRMMNRCQRNRKQTGIARPCKRQGTGSANTADSPGPNTDPRRAISAGRSRRILEDGLA